MCFSFLGSCVPDIWLLGHSYVFRAAQRAEYRPGGHNLGFYHARVSWRGVGGLRWHRVLHEVVDISRSVRGPVILLIHAGGNDVCSVRLEELITIMKADLERIPGFFPQCLLVWSEIVSRPRWQGARDAAAVERSRRTINIRLSRVVRSLGGVVVRHHQLEGDNRHLMLPDGIHLNEIGHDILLYGFQDGIEQALFSLGGGRAAV